MHVAVVSPYDPAPPSARDAAGGHVGGVERALHRLAWEVARRGHEVTLVCSTGGGPSASFEDRLRIVRVPRRGTLLRAPLAALARHVPRDAELVHVPATYPFTTPPVLRRARRGGVPALLDFHFEPDPGFALGRLAARAYRAVGPPSYGLARLVTVRSFAYARTAPSLAGVPEDRWRELPNGVDTDVFRPKAAPHPDGYVLVVGRLVPYKGVAVLLNALARLDPPPPLVVAGDGPLRAELEAQAWGLNLPATFLGRVPDAKLPGLYRRAAVTVLPSVNGQEAFGIALVESMACGTPVVATRLPGVQDVAGLGGLLAEPGDPASLAQALRAALQRGRLPRGEALASRIRARYAWPVVASRLLAVYGEALGGPRAPAAADLPLRAPPTTLPPEVRPPARAGRHPLL